VGVSETVGFGKAKEMGKNIQAIQKPLLAGGQDADQNLLGSRAGFGSVAAEGFAVHHGGTNCLLSGPIRGFKAPSTQKREKRFPIPGQMISELSIAFMAASGLQQSAKPFFQSAPCDGQPVNRYSFVIPSIPQSKGVLEKPFDLLREPDGPSGRILNQVFGSPDQMSETLLMCGVDELIVGSPSIVIHHPVPVQAQYLFGDDVASAGADQICNDVGCNEGPEPLRVAADPPAGLVGIQDPALSDDVTNMVEGGFDFFGGSEGDVRSPAATEMDSVEVVKDAFDFSIAESEFIFHHGDHGLDVGSGLRGGGAEGVGGLFSMSGLNAYAAFSAMSDVDVKSPNDGFSGDILLDLRLNVAFVDCPATIGTAIRQGNVDDLVGLSFREWPMRPGAVIGAGLSTRPLGIGIGVSFGEGRRLAFACPARCFQLPGEVIDGLFEMSDPRFEASDLAILLSDLAILPGDDVQKIVVTRFSHPWLLLSENEWITYIIGQKRAIL